MSEQSSSAEPRSVKIGDNERGGWSSDRPRTNAGPPRPADISVRCRVLRLADRLRYSPGSLVVVVGPSADDRERFVARVFEEPKSVLSIPRVRELIKDKVPPEQLDEKAAELLQAAVTRRIASGESTVVPVQSLDAAERDPFVRAAHAKRRPRHVIFVDTRSDALDEEDKLVVNDLRRRLDAGELGLEGFQTALRLSGAALPEVKRIVFRPPPRDDD